MGLLVHTQFETAEGLPVTGVYCRLSRMSYQPVTATTYHIALEHHTFVSRERRLAGKLPIQTPGIPGVFTVIGAYGDVPYLYGLLKTHLEAQGLTVEDVLEPEPEPTPEASQQSSESTPSTLPTPPTPSESVPPESQPEPQPQSSSEYAPAPAASEA
jgi:hypothetical protein